MIVRRREGGNHLARVSDSTLTNVAIAERLSPVLRFWCDRSKIEAGRNKRRCAETLQGADAGGRPDFPPWYFSGGAPGRRCRARGASFAVFRRDLWALRPVGRKRMDPTDLAATPELHFAVRVDVDADPVRVLVVRNLELPVRPEVQVFVAVAAAVVPGAAPADVVGRAG
jgi:hypothetical protein